MALSSTRFRCSIAPRSAPGRRKRIVLSADMPWQTVLDTAAEKLGLPTGSVTEVRI
jgi:hypothetical protein